MLSSRVFPVVRPIVLLLLASALFACGGSGGSSGGGGGGSGGNNNAVRAGVFADSALDGAHFATDTQSGTTTSGGLFFFRPGETVEFSIGGIVLGSALAAPILTPVDLVSGAVDALDAGVTNRARVLQMLDEDQDPTNGIDIPQAVAAAAAGLSLDFDQTIAAFETDGAVLSVLNALNAALGGARSLPSVTTAQNHLTATIASLGGAFGVLALSGTDTANFPAAFTPTIGAAATNAGALSATWTENVSMGPSIRVTILSLNLIDGDVANVALNVTKITPNESYSYAVNCLARPGRCSGIDVDTNALHADFHDVRLSPSQLQSDATGDITLDGRIDIATPM